MSAPGVVVVTAEANVSSVASESPQIEDDSDDSGWERQTSATSTQ